MAVKSSASLPPEVKLLLDAYIVGDEATVARLLQHGEFSPKSLSILVDHVLCSKLATATAVRIAEELVHHGAVVGAAVQVLRNAAPSQTEDDELDEKVTFVLARLGPVKPVHLFASLHSAPLVVRLLDRGADPNFLNPNDPFKAETPLMRVLTKGYFTTASLLLRAGADPFVRYAVRSQARQPLLFNAIHMALQSAMAPTAAILADLVRRGVDPSAPALEGGGATPLATAIELGNYPAVSMLLALGADATVPGLLALALYRRAYEVAETLIRAGAAPIEQLSEESLASMPAHVVGMLLRSGVTTLPDDLELRYRGYTEKGAAGCVGSHACGRSR